MEEQGTKELTQEELALEVVRKEAFEVGYGTALEDVRNSLVGLLQGIDGALNSIKENILKEEEQNTHVEKTEE